MVISDAFLFALIIDARTVTRLFHVTNDCLHASLIRFSVIVRGTRAQSRAPGGDGVQGGMHPRWRPLPLRRGGSKASLLRWRRPPHVVVTRGEAYTGDGGPSLSSEHGDSDAWRVSHRRRQALPLLRARRGERSPGPGGVVGEWGLDPGDGRSAPEVACDGTTSTLAPADVVAVFLFFLKNLCRVSIWQAWWLFFFRIFFAEC
jgi:hypothetical protein